MAGRSMVYSVRNRPDPSHVHGNGNGSAAGTGASTEPALTHTTSNGFSSSTQTGFSESTQISTTAVGNGSTGNGSAGAGEQGVGGYNSRKTATVVRLSLKENSKSLETTKLSEKDEDKEEMPISKNNSCRETKI